MICRASSAKPRRGAIARLTRNQISSEQMSGTTIETAPATRIGSSISSRAPSTELAKTIVAPWPPIWTGTVEYLYSPSGASTSPLVATPDVPAGSSSDASSGSTSGGRVFHSESPMNARKMSSEVSRWRASCASSRLRRASSLRWLCPPLLACLTRPLVGQLAEGVGLFGHGVLDALVGARDQRLAHREEGGDRDDRKDHEHRAQQAGPRREE